MKKQAASKNVFSFWKWTSILIWPRWSIVSFCFRKTSILKPLNISIVCFYRIVQITKFYWDWFIWNGVTARKPTVRNTYMNLKKVLQLCMMLDYHIARGCITNWNRKTIRLCWNSINPKGVRNIEKTAFIKWFRFISIRNRNCSFKKTNWLWSAKRSSKSVIYLSRNYTIKRKNTFFFKISCWYLRRRAIKKS